MSHIEFSCNFQISARIHENLDFQAKDEPDFEPWSCNWRCCWEESWKRSSTWTKKINKFVNHISDQVAIVKNMLSYESISNHIENQLLVFALYRFAVSNTLKPLQKYALIWRHIKSYRKSAFSLHTMLFAVLCGMDSYQIIWIAMGPYRTKHSRGSHPRTIPSKTTLFQISTVQRRSVFLSRSL